MLDLAEMGVPEGLSGTITSIGGCPEIKQGPGRVVLTTVNHLNNFVYHLTLKGQTGQSETLGVTGYHKFYDESEGWQNTCDLSLGDTLRGADGKEVTVTGVVRDPGLMRVYNFTVERDHDYFVGDLTTLTHNNWCDKIVPSRMQVLDLHGAWRKSTFQEEGLVYLLRDTTSGEALKVGQTLSSRFIGRFEEYVSAGNRHGRQLTLEVFEVPAAARGVFEGQVRRQMTSEGWQLIWDNTGRRLGRSGPGIP